MDLPRMRDLVPQQYASEQRGIALLGGVYDITQDLHIEEPIWFLGGILRPLAGVVVTIDGPMYAPVTQIFDLSEGGWIDGRPNIASVNPVWWGADPNGVNDSSAAINDAIEFCNGSFAPFVEMVAGHYRCLAQILKGQSFHMPIIRGTGGGNNVEPGGVVWDFSESDINDACVKIKGGSGRSAHGGIADITIVGNGKCKGLQFADQCGSYANNIMLENCLDGIEFFNEHGFTEWNKLINCQVDNPGRYSFLCRRGSGTESFHGAEIIDCWTNLSASSPGAIWIGAGCKWYNGTTRARIFYANGLQAPQDAFVLDPAAYPVDTEGYLKCEGGGGFARGASGGLVNLMGPVLSLNGFDWGTLKQKRYSIALGPESGHANGQIASPLDYHSFGPRYITVNQNGEWSTGIYLDGAYLLKITVSAANYEFRHTAVAEAQGYGGEGLYQDLIRWPINDSRGFGAPTFRVDPGGTLLLKNAKYPPGEVTFSVWYEQLSLNRQIYQRFATMSA